jgi:uncharacterized YccA/Bax inhibitor family protein
MRSSNPVLSRNDAFSPGGTASLGAPVAAQHLEDMYQQPSYAPPRGPVGARMTLDDVVAKTGLLFLVALVTAAGAWVFDVGMGVAMVAALVGFGLAMANTFKKQVSPPLVLAYAAVEGVFVGALSHVLSVQYPGIALQAVLGTAAAFVVMLVLYRSGRLRATPTFTKVLVGLGFGYMAFLLVNLGLNLFGDNGVNLWQGGILSVAVSVFAVGLASLFLILDFDQVEKGIAAGAPESESWRAAFGLMVTLVWLYGEMLRLLSLLRD